MKSLIAALAVLIVILGALSLVPQRELPDEMPAPVETSLVPYVAPGFGLSFAYPETYFPTNTDHEGERLQSTITLLEDTPFARALVNGEAPGTEAPPAITVSIFQNDLDQYTTESFIRDHSASNFKLSDGTLTPVTVGGVEGLSYRATGLYESENIVVALPDFVYMFSVGYHAPTDPIRDDFRTVIDSVSFETGRAPTSADGAPPGSIHNLPVPAAVSAVRAFAAQKAGVPASDVLVTSAIEREWPDACLGRGGPDEMCAQMITPGYAVSIEAGELRATYRVNTEGTVIVPDRE